MAEPKPQAERQGGRRANGQFAKGTSGNDGRKKKSPLLAARESTGDGREAVEFLLTVMRGEATGERVTAKGDVVAVGPSIQEKSDAAKAILGLFPKPPTEKEVDDTGGLPLRSLEGFDVTKLSGLIGTNAETEEPDSDA